MQRDPQYNKYCIYFHRENNPQCNKPSHPSATGGAGRAVPWQGLTLIIASMSQIELGNEIHCYIKTTMTVHTA